MTEISVSKMDKVPQQWISILRIENSKLLASYWDWYMKSLDQNHKWQEFYKLESTNICMNVF